MSLPQRFLTELARRRARNPRYSLRAFARDLAIDHATLSQLLRGRRRLTPAMARRLGPKIGLHGSDLADSCAQLDAEAVHQCVSSPGFRPDSRWIATRTGLPLDDVNRALQRLLHDRALVMVSPRQWIHRHG